MNLRASCNPTELPGSDAFDVFADPIDGVLTDEHAACSYGQPVFVRESDGVPMGPADLSGVALGVDLSRDDSYRFACAAAAAGYVIAGLEGVAHLREHAASSRQHE